MGKNSLDQARVEESEKWAASAEGMSAGTVGSGTLSTRAGGPALQQTGRGVMRKLWSESCRESL